MINIKAFQIDTADNVATMLDEIYEGNTTLLIGNLNEKSENTISSINNIPIGHKIALRDIREGENIIKYGVVIGKATKNISKGSWVHLHNIKSIYDERSSHLDVNTGAPKDTKYE